MKIALVEKFMPLEKNRAVQLVRGDPKNHNVNGIYIHIN